MKQKTKPTLTMLYSACSCRPLGATTIMDVEYCPLHASAPKLLEAAKKGLCALKAATSQFRNITNAEREALNELDAAITAAEGRA